MASQCISFENAPSRWNFFVGLVFLHFLALSADSIYLDLGYFQLKIGHLVGFLLLVVLSIAKGFVFIGKRFYYCAILILSSTIISSFFSDLFFRSFPYSIVYVFSFLSYFVVPVNIMYFQDENRMFKLYVLSYLCIGSYAALQFFSSIIGIVLPFSVQTIVYVRGSAFSHEPSFYALYAIPFVMFLNAKWLFKQANGSKEKGSLMKVIFANLFLLVSTATSAFFSYIVFFFVLFFFKRFPAVESCFSGLRKKTLQIFLLFATFFSMGAFFFSELFRQTFLKFFYYGLTIRSFQDRTDGMLSAINTFLEYPLFGVGLGGVGPRVYRQECGGAAEQLDREILNGWEPTNVLTEVLGSLGLYGFIVLCIFIVVLWDYFRKILEDRRLLQDEKINILALFVSIIVMLICLQINQGLFRCYVWTHIGVGVGYVLKVKSRLLTR